MKLYTEFEVRSLLNDLMLLECSVDEAIDSLTPIELPSEEEIFDESTNWWSPSPFIAGAKWVIEQIKKQDNGE